jgi:sialate O-acetylesterase
MCIHASRVLLLAGLIHFAAVAEAAVRLPRVFGDHMVLQRDRMIPVWGWAEPGEHVTVSLCSNSASARTNGEGRWSVQLGRLPAGGPHELKVQGKNEVVCADVMLGEVWVCSGQSNMEWTVQASTNAGEEIANGNLPLIRMIKSPHHTSTEPQDDLAGGEWQVCSPDTVAAFSAVGYFFGRELHQQLDVPIGLLNLSWGGTRCEAWTSREALETHSGFAAILKRTDNEQDESTPHRAAVLYNAMIAPVIPYRIRGAIWYQGESNVGRSAQYAELFPTMIHDWRARWGQGNFPFLFVQLAPYRYGGHHPQHCAELWDSQLHTLRTVTNTGMAVTTDITLLQDIHPPNKQEVGRRLAAWALADTYDRKQIPSGPLYRSLEIDGDTIRIDFDYAGKKLRSADGKPLSEFTIAAANGFFLPADATIDGATVVVHSPAIGNPVAVRFAYYDSAVPNLVNSAGLPASPFRTDDLPLLTVGNE